MKKEEMRSYAAQLVECGKGLAYAEAMPEGEGKTAAEELLNSAIDDVVKQLELICEDVSFDRKGITNDENSGSN